MENAQKANHRLLTVHLGNDFVYQSKYVNRMIPGKGGWVQEERGLMITSKSLRGTSKTMVMRCALMMFCLCSLNDVSKGQQVHDDMYLRGTQDPK